jgi:hypothetical protein
MCRIGQKEPALVVALWFHSVTIALMVWPLLLGLPEHAKLVAARDCLLLLGIATTSFFAQLLMTRSFQLIPAARAAAVSFTGGQLGLSWQRSVRAEYIYNTSCGLRRTQARSRQTMYGSLGSLMRFQ